MLEEVKESLTNDVTYENECSNRSNRIANKIGTSSGVM